jgi:hypothetical protein
MDKRFGLWNVRSLYRAGSVDNIRIDLVEVGWADVDWIGLAQDRDRWRALVNAVLNLHVPGDAGKLSSGYTIGGLSSSAQLHGVSYLVSSHRSDCLKFSSID